jgi:hypothetical protein
MKETPSMKKAILGSSAETGPDLGRRRLLAKIGLAATAAYSAPVLLRLSEARASPGSRNSGSRASLSRASLRRGSFSRNSGSRNSGSRNS